MGTATAPSYFKGYGDHVASFAERWIVQTKGRWAGQPLTLEGWQRDTLDELYLLRTTPDGGREFVYREALVGIARKNGKSTFSSAIALYGLIASGENAPEVYAAAAATDQARVVFDQARRFIEGSPRLQDWLKPYRNVIECKANGGIFRVLSSDAPLQHGLNPSLVVIDELHAHKNAELYYALTTGQLARENPLVVSITTAGFDRESILWQVYEHGRRLRAEGREREERFLFRWWQAPDDCKLDDEAAWRAANPSTWIDLEDLRRERGRLPEHIFRRLHLNQWTESEETWLTEGMWAACRESGARIPDGARGVVLGVDAALRYDSAAVNAVWRRPDGKVIVESTVIDPPTGRDLDMAVLENVVRDCARKWRVAHVAYDRMMFVRSAQMLEDEGLPMLEFPQTNERMAPASARLYDAIAQREIVHNGDQTLARHVAAGAAVDTERGWRLTKRKARQRVDALIALVMAHEVLATVPARRAGVHFF
jgi:phage terminase large subunit-like protein